MPAGFLPLSADGVVRWLDCRLQALPGMPASKPYTLPVPLPQALNQAISDLQTFSGGGPNKQSADHSHTVVDNLRSRLKDATQVRGGGILVGKQADCRKAVGGKVPASAACRSAAGIQGCGPAKPRPTHAVDVPLPPLPLHPAPGVQGRADHAHRQPQGAPGAQVHVQRGARGRRGAAAALQPTRRAGAGAAPKRCHTPAPSTQLRMHSAACGWQHWC